MLITAFTIGGCSKKLVTINKKFVSEQLKFVHDGSTSQREILNRLGEPANEYEDRRILTYFLYEDQNNRLKVVSSIMRSPELSSKNIYYNLILVFGTDLVLEQHSLIRVR